MSNLYFGQNSDFEIVSLRHGSYLLGFVEGFDVDVQHTNKKLFFFGKKEALTVSIFEGVSGRFGFLETEERYLVSAVMDVDPTTLDVINDDPSAYYPFNLILNVKNEEGIIENGIFVKGCRVTGLPESIAPREEQHGNISYIGATRYKIKGGGILHSRIVGSAPVFSTTKDIAVVPPVAPATTPFVATLTEDFVQVNIENNTTKRKYLAVYKNGNDITKDPAQMANLTFGALNTIDFAAFAATDVYDIYTVFKP